MIPDPIPTVTVNSVAYDFSRRSVDHTKGVFATADGAYVLTFAQQSKKRNRFSMRLDHNFLAEDVFVPDTNSGYSHSAYVVWDSPKIGVTAADNNVLGSVLGSLMVAGTPDYALRLLQGEL